MQRFAVHGLSCHARLGDRGDAFLRRRVHEVDRAAGVAREADDVTEREVLGHVVVDQVQVVALRAALALQRLGHVGHDVVLFRVHGHDPAVLRDFLEDARQVTVRHPDRPERREDLEARDAVLDRLADLADRLRRDLARQDVVEREVGVRMATEDVASPLDRLRDRHARRVRIGCERQVAGEVDDRRHAAERRGARGRFRRLCHHVRRAAPDLRDRDRNVRVRLDAAGHDDLAAGVDGPRGVGRQRAGLAQRDDRLALHPDVEQRDALRRHDLSALDDEIEHGAPPQAVGAPILLRQQGRDEGHAEARPRRVSQRLTSAWR